LSGFIDANDLRITWTVAWFVPLVVTVIIFIYLWIIATTSLSADWTEPYSLTKPFFPPNRYPMHFWLLLAIADILNGFASLIHDLFLGSISPSNWMVFLCGIAMLSSTLIFWFSPLNAHNRKS
jgi:hypothetical protein